MTMAALLRADSDICPTDLHRHQLTCERCGVSDQTVASTMTRSGRLWAPTCSTCAAKARASKAERIAAVERSVGGAS